MSFETAATISGVMPGEPSASASRVARQKPLAEFADGEVGEERRRLRFVGVDDQPRDFVVLVRNDGLVQEVRERNVGEGRLVAAARSISVSAAIPGELVTRPSAGEALASNLLDRRNDSRAAMACAPKSISVSCFVENACLEPLLRPVK